MEQLATDAEEESRVLGKVTVGPSELALAFTRRDGPEAALLVRLGVDRLVWRDEIVRIRARNEVHDEVRTGTPPPTWESPVARRFSGGLQWRPAATHVLDLARQEADANGEAAGPAHFLVGLLLELNSVGAGTANWLGMRPGLVRAAAGLRNERRVIAGGATPPPGTGPGPTRRGRLVLHGGGGVDRGLWDAIVALAPVRRPDGTGPHVVVVDLGWLSHRPGPDAIFRRLDDLPVAPPGGVAASGLFDRSDASSPEVCARLAAADLIWFRGGHNPSIFDRLWTTPALDAIRRASDDGAVVGGTSAGALVWGAGCISDFATTGAAEPFALFGWLPMTVVFAHFWPNREAALRERVAQFPGCRGLAVAHQGAVVVEPGWGDIWSLDTGADEGGNYVVAGPAEPLIPVDPR